MISRRRHLRPCCAQGAFTLVELLVVLTIIGILAALAVPSFSYLTRDLNLSTAAGILRDGLDLARETAAAKNSTVEVRIYQLPSTPNGTPTDYQAFQVFLKGDQTIPVYTAVTKITYLPNPIVLSTDNTKTSLLTLAGQPAAGATPPAGAAAVSLPVVGTNYKYLYFCFKANGSTTLTPTQQWLITLVPKFAPATSSGLPANFATVKIDPVLSRIAVYRP